MVATFPVADDSDVYYRTDIRFTLAIEETGATVVVTDAGGAEVAGATSVLGTVVTWNGTADLSPSTSYTATLNYECGAAPVSFTTSDTGAPTGVDITDLVFELDLASGEWVEPPGVGEIIASQLGAVQVLVSPKVVTPTEITMIGALGDGVGGQDPCSPYLDFGQAAGWTDPYFELSSELLTLDVAGVVVDVEDLLLAGAFAPDGSRIQGAVLQGSVDTRPLGSLVGATGTGDDAVCQLVAIFGITCDECGDGTGPYCLSINVDNIVAEQIPGATPLEMIDQAAIDANPACTGA